ncbi:hypothetical protein GGR58DRAFT_497676 [Xylaria digitata]|nr:hypothetical protein GGR58DRAFT_497676 [Xylaria digitata]
MTSLHSFSTTLQEADIVLRLNIDILYEILEYYKSYVEDPETPEHIRRGCHSDMGYFVQRTSRIIREMRTERTRISTIIVIIEDEKAIFDAITQLRNIELNRRASKRIEAMTELTIQTKKDTSSMHFVTFVTLVFLPGMFVAVRYALPTLCNFFSSRLTTDDQTFLGAGFCQWPQPSDGDAPAVFPDFRPRYFLLFFEISMGLTLATVLLWWNAWRQFSEEQWWFLPLQFRHSDGTRIEQAYEGNDVDVRQIRPITILEQLHPGSSSSAKIYKIQPHESSGLPEEYGNHPIILKEYPVDELTGQFEQEHIAYIAIGNNMRDMQLYTYCLAIFTSATNQNSNDTRFKTWVTLDAIAYLCLRASGISVHPFQPESYGISSWRTRE